MMNYTGGTGLPYDGHKGVDFSMSYQPVLAAAPGEVTQARWYNWALRESGYGLYVIISHANGYETRYAYHVVAIRRERPPEGRVTFVLVDEDGWEGVVAGDRSAGPAWGRCGLKHSGRWGRGVAPGGTMLGLIAYREEVVPFGVTRPPGTGEPCQSRQ